MNPWRVMDSEVPVVRPEDQRAADADRSKVAERLRVALDEGRLDLSEYDERLQQALAAKTFGDLDALTVDIPGVASASDSQLSTSEPSGAVSQEADFGGAVTRGGRRWHRHGRGKKAWARLGAATIFFTGIWAISWVARGGGDPPSFWPIWILGIWALGLLGSTMSRHTGE